MIAVVSENGSRRVEHTAVSRVCSAALVRGEMMGQSINALGTLGWKDMSW